MALNNCARLTCPMIGAKTTLRVTVNKINDGVVLTPSIGQSFYSRAPQQSCYALLVTFDLKIWWS
jgi:hypothetical protein